MISRLILAMTTGMLATHASAADVTDILKCRLSQPTVIHNADNEAIRTDHFLVVQNSNRHYATVFVGRKNIGMTSYQRSAKGQQISVLGWSVQLSALLGPEKTSREIPEIRAFTSYAGLLDGSQIAVRCSFTQENRP